MSRAVIADEQTRFVLTEDRIPRTWYNIAADLPVPPAPVLPVLARPEPRPPRPGYNPAAPLPVPPPRVPHRGPGRPIGPAALAPLFPRAPTARGGSPGRETETPDPVRDAYRLYRPSPL